jgi:hypothetical protein
VLSEYIHVGAAAAKIAATHHADSQPPIVPFELFGDAGVVQAR